MITDVLSQIDLSLIASLVLMVVVGCYENFGSRFELEDHKYKPSWMGRARMFGNPAVDFVIGLERNWSNVSGGAYIRWVAGLVFRTGWRFW